MRKVVVAVLLVLSGLIVLIDQNPQWVKGIWPGQSSDGELERTSFFKRLSEIYYGSDLYWEELSLVNKAWSDRKDTELIIPSIEAIRRLKNRQNVKLSDNYQRLQAELPEYDTEPSVDQRSSLELVYLLVGLFSFIVSSARYLRRKYPNAPPFFFRVEW